MEASLLQEEVKLMTASLAPVSSAGLFQSAAERKQQQDKAGAAGDGGHAGGV